MKLNGIDLCLMLMFFNFMLFIKIVFLLYNEYYYILGMVNKRGVCVNLKII